VSTASRCAILAVALAVVAAACTPPTVDSDGPEVVPVPRKAAPARTSGFDTTTFRVGVIADLSGPTGAANRSVLAGVEAYWSTVNSLGGVDARFPVELVVRDVGGPSPAAAAVRAYAEIQSDVAVFALVGGTAVVDAVRQLASEDQILVVPSTRQSTWANLETLLPVGSSYAAEAFSGLAWMARDDSEADTWCVATDVSLVGEDQRVGALLAAQELDAIDDLVTIDIAVEGVVVAVDQMSALACQKLWVATDSLGAVAVLNELAARDVDIDVGVGGEVVLPLSAATQTWADGRLIVATDAPSWGDDAAGSVLLRSAFAAYVPDARPDPWVRMGFASQYPVDVLLRTGTLNVDVSRGALWAIAQGLGPINTGDLVASFDRSGGIEGIPREISVHVIDPIAGDPLGLRFVERFESPAAGALDVLWDGAL